MRPITRSLALGLLCTLPLLNSVLAAPTVPRDDAVTPRAAIAVKLNKSASSRARSVAGTELVEDLIRKAQSGSGLVKRDTQFNVLPLITTLSSDKVSELVQRAAANDPTYEPVDFGAWFQVYFPESEDSETDPEIAELLSTLTGYPEVASSQRLSGGRRPQSTVQPNDDPLFSSQGYLTGNGVGINAVYAWGFPGGDGAGTTFIDVEGGWQLEHEDLAAQNITVVAGRNNNDRYGANYPHGTAVLGEVLMADNTLGGVGIAPATQGHVVGIQRIDIPAENEAEAILEAAAYLSPGDVILVEMQTGDANNDLWPIEILDAQFDAIRTATAAGITVIEPAANGGVDLDQPVLRLGETVALALLNRNSPNFRESGAIMVGAGSSAYPRTRLSFSNYGNRVDVHAWGENVATTGVVAASTGGWADTYVDFDGTSAAAPIVAGAALSIQGIVNANRGSKLTPTELRNLIGVGGTATTNPSVDRIGVQPDLKALIDGGYLD